MPSNERSIRTVMADTSYERVVAILAKETNRL
jgi:hypothetical protein